MQLSEAKYNFRKIMVRKAEHIFLVKAFHSLQFLFYQKISTDSKKAFLFLFHMVNSVTYINVGTSLEKAIKIVLNKL